MRRASPEHTEQLGRLTALLERVSGADADLAVDRVTLDVASRPAADGGAPLQHEVIELPRDVVTALLDIARGLAQGRMLQIVPHDAEISTQAAADLLGVSRPHVIALIDRGELECRRVGTHRRLVTDEVLAYRAARNARRRDNVTAAQREAAEVEGDY